jgi:hypothetical protein
MMKFQPSDPLTTLAVDPNPNELAEFDLTLKADTKTMVEITSDTSKFVERMHDLYGGKCPTIIIDRCLDQLRLYGSAIIYVGSFKQCIAFAGSFHEMGFEARYAEIKL